MTKVSLCLLPLVLGIALLFCTFHDASVAADFRYVNPSGIHTLDPARMSWTQDFRVARNIWEGLTATDAKTGRPMEGAADFPPAVSSDGLTYTFTIKPSSKWSNGDPVTAHDFLRGWRRALEPGCATDYTFLLTDHIVGAAAYVKWRQDAVAALAAISRLRDGWGIDVKQARRLDHAALLKTVRRLAPKLPEPPSSESDHQWLAWSNHLAENIDTCARIHQATLDGHGLEMADTFARVGIHALDEQTLQVQLQSPCSYFLELTAFPTLFPCHRSIELLREPLNGGPITAEGLVSYDPQWTKPNYRRNGYKGLITNGPYMLSEWEFKRRLRLTVNPFFRDAETIACRTIDMMVMENISASIMAYEAGSVDFLPAMDVPYDHEIVRLARSGARPDFHLCNTVATYFFNFNCADEMVGDRRNPFTDPRVRRAFTLAADRINIVSQLLRRGDRVAYSFVPHGAIRGYDPPAGLRRDVQEANRLLREAGYESGDALGVIELLYTPADALSCQAMARTWEEQLGVRIELRCQESKTFAEEKAARRYMIARANWYADYEDPTTFLDCLASGNGNNDSGYSNAIYDGLLSRASAAETPVQRFRLLQEAERIAIEQDCPILPVLHYTLPIAIKPYVKGLYPNPRLRFPFRYISIDR